MRLILIKNMYVCICNHINEKKFDQAAIQGDPTVEGVCKALGLTFQCGRCEKNLESRLEHIESESREIKTGAVDRS